MFRWWTFTSADQVVVVARMTVIAGMQRIDSPFVLFECPEQPDTFYRARFNPDRIVAEGAEMVKSRQQTARKPATKYANLQKKMQKRKAQAKKAIGKKK